MVHTVAQKGYANARVSDICQAAGVTRPVFYALFAGKEEALLATYRHGTADVAGTLSIPAHLAPVPFLGHDEAARELRPGGGPATVTAPCIPRARHAAGR